MGIPKFFRWLTRRYPLILKNIHREEDCPPIDNLYLDLNGIIHNCIHGNDAKLHEKVSVLAAQGNFDEVWCNIMKAIDEIVHTVKPGKLLFMAVDGVAPRAKMNQQRARRFRSAKDASMLREKLLAEGKDAPMLFDSNAISPGTKFMYELNRQLEFFVQYKINTDALYQKLEIVLSDSSVPGEGEHKMMDYIRQAKTKEDYNPNTRHCFYGADADLIMLSLLTHEPNFMIIREEHVIKKIKQGGVQRIDISKTFNFQLIFINLLREYFQFEYSEVQPKMRMRFDLERIIDDFVFFCFFIGNDFLPSLTALDISEGSLDQLIDLYKSHLPNMTDYITEAGKIYWDRAEPFIRMLGNHELESFRLRVDSIKHAREERIVSFQADFAAIELDKATQMKNRIREILNQKKVVKIFKLKEKKRDKTYKRFMLLKRFEEDEERTQEISKKQKEMRAKMLEKYRQKRAEQEGSPATQSEGDKKDPIVDTQQLQSLKDILEGLKDEYFSDLNVQEIGDDEVSDVNEEELNLDGASLSESNPELRSKLKVQADIIDKYSEANLLFMTEFIKMFSTNPSKAKAFYYSEKLKVDVQQPEGGAFKKRMLMKYLEGLQWVLFYYYKGAQHWRWYYPYHYAPMISDIDENICENFLSGKVTIEQFEIDKNCSDVNVPYTPFQQLFSIMPTRSLHLLPSQYLEMSTVSELVEFFPADFDIDLNGRALPWEAACLIPFVDEKQAISVESQGLQVAPLNEDETKRNQVYFYFKKFKYDKELKKQAKRELSSSIKKLKSLQANYATVELLYDYQDVGKHSFLPKLLAGVELPCVDFPSLKWLGVQNVTYDEKVINKVAFKRVLICVPSCMEDRSTEDLEKFVNKFVTQANKEMYIGAPYQLEGFPTVFEDERFIYHVYGDVYTNVYKVHKEQQQMDKEKFGQFIRRQNYKNQDNGFYLEAPRAFVSIQKMKDVQYDSKKHQFYKVYEEESVIMPLCMAMKRRDNSHYMNVNLRCNSLLQSFKSEREVLCLNMQLFGVMGQVQAIDLKRENVKVDFDKEVEESKIHDAFFGQRVLMDQELHKQTSSKRYYSDSQIEQLLRLHRGIVNKLTGSCLVTFYDREKFEKQVVDLGLNIKNFVKKVHIPDYVRFVADLDNLADYQYDDYQHNQHARGARHIRKHWEYSQECFDVIKEYLEQFSDVLEAISKGMRINKQILDLKDLFGKQVDEFKMINRIRKVTQWIEKCPLSHLPYVEMGFDALNEDLIAKLDLTKTHIKEQFQTIKLKCRAFEYLQPTFLYQEHFPFWSQPFSEKHVSDYRVGDRVININSTRREYVPFGLRGTVVGHTNDKVIILFDDQYLGGNNIHGHCDDLKGGSINPNYLINLTHKFHQILRKNSTLVMSFVEQALEGTPEAIAQALQLNQLMQQEEQKVQQQPPHQHHHRVPHQQQQYQHQQHQEGGQQAPQQHKQQQKKQYQKRDQQPGASAAPEETKQPQAQFYQASHRQVHQAKYVVKKQVSASETAAAQETVVEQEATTTTFTQDQEDENIEAYQDLKQLITQMQISAPTFVPNEVIQPPTAYQQQPSDQAVENDSQASGFVPFTLPNMDPSLQGNSDFNQLLSLMNTLASQLQTNVFDPNQQNAAEGQLPGGIQFTLPSLNIEQPVEPIQQVPTEETPSPAAVEQKEESKEETN